MKLFEYIKQSLYEFYIVLLVIPYHALHCKLPNVVTEEISQIHKGNENKTYTTEKWICEECKKTLFEKTYEGKYKGAM